MSKRERRTYAQIFTDGLKALSDGEPVSNKALREHLGWDDEKYNQTKERLLEEGTIRPRRGRGGSVALIAEPGAKALRVFVSYSHADEPLKIELLKHFEPLRRAALIETWHDGKLAAGAEWKKEIAEHLAKADIFLPLISIDFINSIYCYEVELEQALGRHTQGTARIIPVILRRCIWAGTPLANLLALPKDAKPVVEWLHRDEALVDVAEGLRRYAQEFISTK